MKLLNNHRMGLTFVMICLLAIGLNATAQEGQIITETVHSPSLEGNLLGDSPDRPVTIYLPPSYQTQTDRFYPVVYLLHGFTRDNTLWTRANELFDPGNILNYMQSWLAQGRITEMIIVMPSSHNRYDGSFYNNSSVGGNWADYIAKDLVDYIDRHYRTLPQRFSRAVIGHSMGGYGGMTLGLDHPDVFGCMGSMSGLLDMAQFPFSISQAFADGAKLKNLSTFASQSFNVRVAVALSAAIAGNANNPPLYADFPWERNDSGRLIQNQAVWNKFLERDVLRRLSKNVEALNSMQAIYVDCGTSDQFNFIVDARRVHDELQRLNIPHHYSEFAGGHVTNLMTSTGDAFELFSSVMAFEMLAAELTRNPVPADGAVYADTWVVLSWTPGDFAVSHDVYLGESFDDVNDATPDSETFRGNQADTFLLAGLPGSAYPDGLVPGTTYYWRIDEVNEADPNSPWRGDIWSFLVPPKTAYEPLPADGSKFIDEAGPTLSWAPGLGAGLHTVYFSDDFETVSNADGDLGDELTTYSTGPLETETTYYWRVDEYDGFTKYKGDIWSFTTAKASGGIQGQYYKGMDFNTLVFTRIDPQINFDWGTSTPSRAVGSDQFSVRWTGEVEAAFTETYTFYVSADDGVRLWVDGQLLVDEWTDHSASEFSGQVDLVDGNTYSLVMEMYENSGDALAELRWSSPSTPKQFIPQGALTPAK